jgi:hypothetical protein
MRRRDFITVPERLGIGRANVHPENLTQAVAVDTYEDHRDRHDAPASRGKPRLRHGLHVAAAKLGARDERRLYVIPELDL